MERRIINGASAWDEAKGLSLAAWLSSLFLGMPVLLLLLLTMVLFFLPFLCCLALSTIVQSMATLALTHVIFQLKKPKKV